MPTGEFEGRTAAEAAIKACDKFGVSRSQLKYEVLSDEGEGLDRLVRIRAEAPEGASEESNEGEAAAGEEERGERRERRSRGGRERGERGGRGERGRGRRGGRGRRERGGRGERDRGRGRGGRGGRERNDSGDGIEALLDLETVPSERPPERPELTGEVSPKASKGKEVLEEIIRLSGLKVTVHLVEDSAEEIHYDLRGEDEARVIGNKGESLLSLQFLLNRMVGRAFGGEEEGEQEQVLVLDAAAYRSRRRDALANLAKRLAQRAIEEGKAVRLSPMSAHDRRVFHLTLKEMEEVETRSEGDGLYRNLLIIPAEYA